MSKRFFTSDWHLNSNNIIKYTNRPFVNADDMNMKLYQTCNKMAPNKHDTIIHAGDLILTSPDRHHAGNHDVPATDAWSYNTVCGLLKANFITLSGNHDDSHSAETVAKSMTVDLNHKYRNVFVSHYPSDHKWYRGPDCSQWKSGMGIALCGHVHDSWIVHYDWNKNVLNINVGVDVWDYKPVEDVELTELLDFLSEQKLYEFRTSFWLSKPQLNKVKIAWKQILQENREQRKAERYAKKGLTPEECQRRKEEAMRKKGLICSK